MRRIWGTALSLLVLTGCLLKDEGAVLSVDPRLVGRLAGLGSIEGFKQSVYPLVTEKCSSCHGATQAPKFAVDDLDSAHATALGLVNFKDVRQSKLVTKSGDGHCGDTCSKTQRLMTDAIELWKTAVESEPGDTGGGGGGGESMPEGRWISTEKALPTNLDKVTFQVVNWPLTGANASLPANASIQVQIKLFDDASYIVRRPRVLNAPGFYFGNLMIHVNGEYRPEDSLFVTMSAFVPAGDNDQELSGLGMIIAKGGLNPDRLSLSLGNVSPGMCKNVSGFQTMVHEPVFAQSCLNCHGAGASNGYNMVPGAAADFVPKCQQALIRVNKVDPTLSLLYRKACEVGFPHQGGKPTDAGDCQAILNWIDSEK